MIGMARLVVSLMMIMVTISPCVYGNEISDHREMEVQQLLKRLNKPPLKSIKSEDGDIIDCVPFACQPAFDHCLPENHTVQMRPTFDSNGDHYTDTINDAKVITQVWQKSGVCPENTVSIRRTKREEVLRAKSIESFGRKTLQEDVHEYAAMRITNGRFDGTKFTLNVWKPYVEINEEFSLVQTWLTAGPSEELNSIEAGLQVYPRIYDGDRDPRLFVYWTANGYQPGKPGEGCYNILCVGFRQTSNHIAVGATSMAPFSQYGGQQYDSTFEIWQSDGKWWLKHQNEIVGYWPGHLFNHLQNEASEVTWGGEIINEKTGGRHTSTDMGSGHFAEEEYGKACYVRNILAYDRAIPPQGHLIPLLTNANCYNLKVGNDGTRFGYHFYFGGPGRNDKCP